MNAELTDGSVSNDLRPFDPGMNAPLPPLDFPLLTPDRIIEMIRAGHVPSDRAFDAYLPERLARASPVFWTPLRAARQVADWIAALRLRSLVDIGSGAGKLCVAVAVACPELRVVGIEQRARLVDTATELSRLFGVSARVRFVCEELDEQRLPDSDVYYLFNPFGENLFGPVDHLDADVVICGARFREDVARIQRFLHQAPVGKRVITYNGFGGDLPPSWSLLDVDRTLPSVLQLWERTGPVAPSP